LVTLTQPALEIDRARTLKLWLMGAAILFFAFFAWITLFRAGPYGPPGHQWGSPAHRTDFTVYRDAAAAVLHGQDPYVIRNVRGWAYVYPPPYSIVMVPFALLALPVSVLAWYFVCVGLTISAVSMSGRLAETASMSERKKLAVLFIPALIMAVWFTVGLTRGQASVLMTWLVIAAIFWEKKGRTPAGAACLAGAVLLKAFALTLLCYYIWRRKWKMVAATLVAILLGGLVLPSAVFGWHGNLHYISEWTHEVAAPALGSESSRTHSELYDQLLSMERPRNQDLGSVMQRLIKGDQTRLMVLALAAALALPIWLLGRRANARSEPLILGAAVVWMLLVSPVAEDHYFSLYVLPAAYALAASMDANRFTRRFGYAMLTVVGLLNVGAVLDLGRGFEIYGAVFWGGILLFGSLLYLAHYEQQRPAPTFQPR
jgi:glycosyl transferase family 87